MSRGARDPRQPVTVKWDPTTLLLSFIGSNDDLPIAGFGDQATALVISGLSFSSAVAKIIGGATSLSLRNNADNADNLIITDAGAASLRSDLTILGKTFLTDGTAANPSLSFTSETGLGFYRTAGTVHVAVGGADKVQFLVSQILPAADRGINLGSAANRFDVGFFSSVVVGSTLTAGGSLLGNVQMNVSGPLIYSGSGAPTISAAVKGSLYLRSDGTGTTDRIYVAKDTAGTWASLTSAS